MDLVSGFPKNLAYTLKQLSNFTKQTVKVMPDRSRANFGDTTRFKLPSSALIDLRTVAIYADVSLGSFGTGSNLTYAHLPRNTNSLIQQLNVTCNGQQICNINDYNLLYNTLFDLEGADISQTSKRKLENFDPSVYYKAGAVAAANLPFIATNAQDSSVANSQELKRPILINNFLGVISSASTRVWDLDDTSDILVEIRWVQITVCWGGTNTSTSLAYSTALTGDTFIDNIRMTCSKINFQSSDYYDLKAQKLEGDGLKIGYYDYFQSRGTTVKKSNSVSMNFNINTNSLDQVIATFQKGDYSTMKPLTLQNSSTTTMANLITFNKFLAEQVTNTGTAAGVGDGFNQSYYFMRAGCDLLTSQFTINSVNIDPYALPPSEIWNNNLIALGNNQLDMGSSGVHAGVLSLYHFLKYYFCHILSLENISGDGQFWRSGLSGNGSTINIGYTATFDGNNTEEISPVIFCRSTKVLTISGGHLISVV
jgi:hypothetical protein